jgi:cytochrome P450
MAAVAPDVQKRAQQEIDSVVGRNRLPTYDDWESLPYVEAVMREVLRWRPVLPLGIPHRVIDDDIYKGYLIPKGELWICTVWRGLSHHIRQGSLVIWNAW